MSINSKFGKAVVFFIIAILAALLIILTSLKEPESEDSLVLPVKIVNAEKGDLEKNLRNSGFIESETIVTILPRIGGTLTDISLEMGDSVEKGQLLATIDSEPYELSFNQAKASFLAAESTFKRVSNLYATKSVSQQNYDEAKANYDTLKSIYNLAELNLSYTKLKSPVKGVVLEKHVSKGSLVAPQVPVFTIGDIDNLKVKAGIPEIHYSFFQKFKENMDIKITVPALDNKIFRASISNIAPFITPQTRNFIVKCQ
ncbi:MAG: efflux RND transporter periplasmic adaptor subunit, partial [Spirochaetaceae bacterium]|nr:efflux RND transporter periplasmic adaptor subunit [Spirochaetaceae bacterium]